MKFSNKCNIPTPGPNLDSFFVFNNQTLPPFTKSMQKALIQNTCKRDWIGGSEIFGSLSSKKCPLS